MMLQDIAPHVYHNPMRFQPPRGTDAALVCTGEGVLLRQTPEGLILPRVEELQGGGQFTYAFSIDDRAYYLARGEAQGYSVRRDYRGLGPREVAFACAVGQSLARWYRANRFCGACGSPMEESTRERAMVCPKCRHVVYPKICPAVIVAVCQGDRLLLTKYAGRNFRRYALVAGFNEIGETIEQTVAREVLEETGLRVKHLRFYKSQPWVVTDSLLFGFFAELDGGDQVRLQEDELSEGRWFSREELPTDHSGDSLTGEMIECFRRGQEPGWDINQRKM